MTKLTSKSKIPVEPSSRDSISSWLDVLTSMLVMPDAQRAQVRDELEDHLRSRVDDLLILGKSEPESIRIAVAELGETAELARLISSANKPRHPYRRYTMNALLIAATGSLLALGIHTVVPSSTIPATQTHTTQEVAVTGSAIVPFDDIRIDVRNGTLGQMVEELQTGSKVPLIVHWPMFESIGFDRDTMLDIDSDPIPTTLVLTILAERTEQYFKDSIVLHRTDDQYELGSRSQFDHRTIEKRIYDLSAFIEPMPVSTGTVDRQLNNVIQSNNNQSMDRIVDMLTSHVSNSDWVNVGGDLAYASIIGNNLVVSAPTRMHDEIKTLIAQLQQIAINSQIETEQRLALEQDQQKQRLSRLRQEYEGAKSQYKQKFKTVSELESQANIMGFDLSALRRAARESEVENTDEIDVLLDKISEIGFQIHGQQLEVDEAKSRFERLQTMLLKAESDLVFAELNQISQIDPRFKSHGDMNTVSIFGQVDRPGVFELPSNGSLTLSRLLISADAQNPDARVILNRNGNEQDLGRVHELMSSEQSKFILREGDEFRITIAN